MTFDSTTKSWRGLKYLFIIATTVSLGLVTQDVSAQSQAPHTVWLAPAPRAKSDSTWFPQSISQQQGQIENFDASTLSLRTADASETKKFAANRVIRVASTDLSTAESEAIQLYQSEKYSAAVIALVQALGSESDSSDRAPVWRQQWLSMLAAKAAWKSNRAKISLELVSQLDRRPLPTMVLAELPIQWNRVPREQAVSSMAAAGSNLENASSAVRLVSASWLLSSPTESERAIETLKTLAKDTSRLEIAMLAETLRWRSEAPNVVRERWREWERKIDRMPMVLQTGPLRSLVEEMETAGLNDDVLRLKLALQL